MSDTKTYIFPEGGTGGSSSGLMAVLPALLQRQGLDPNIAAMLCNRGGGNSWGNDLIGLIVILVLFGGFSGFGGLGGFGGRFMPGMGGGVMPTQLSNDANTAVIMQAVQRNGMDIQTLATALNTSGDNIIAAIHALSQQMCNVASQTGQSFNQVLTQVMQGNNSIQAQICSCCCDLKSIIANLGTSVERGFAGVNTTVERATSSLANETFKQTCSIEKTIADSTEKIVAGQRAAEMREMSREMAAKDDKITALTTQLGFEHQAQNTANVVAQAVAPVNAAVADVSARLAKLECKAPETVTLPYSPVVGVPSCIAAQYGLYNNGFGPFANGIWG